MPELVASLKRSRNKNFQCGYLDTFDETDQTLSMTKRVTPRFKAPAQRRRIFLKEWRKYRGLTQEALAERVGWGVSNVSQLEQGRQGYSQEGLEALAEALQCDPGQILNVDPSKDEGIWSIWEVAEPAERDKIVEIAKTITRKTGTGG